MRGVDHIPSRAGAEGSDGAVRHVVLFFERRRVPWWWWLVALLIAVPSVEIVAVFGPDRETTRSWVVAVVALAATITVIAAGLVSLSRSSVTVDPEGLHVDRRLLPAGVIGRVRALDRETARLVLGRDARADARLSIRPWVHTAVQIEVADDAESTPYWVVGTRRPDELATVLAGLRDQHL
jgi:hypothetical protein